MKKIICSFIMVIVWTLTSVGQDSDLFLSAPESGTQVHKATHSITMGPLYSYTPNGGTMIAKIVQSAGNGIENPVIAGQFSSDFQYTDTQNTDDFSNQYTGHTTNDVFYTFTLTREMLVTMTHDGSILQDTYMYLLDSTGNLIDSNDNYSGVGACSSTLNSFIQKKLSPGTYYVVSEGTSENGVIKTNITGYCNEFNYPDMPSAYSSEPESVGAVKGSFEVSGTGAATFSIPIDIPLGVGGMQPALSIMYSSQLGNGIVGWGCNLAGISVITRVPKSIYFDEIAKGLTHLGDDAYSLNGQRLIYSSGTAGEEGAVYYPESDPFTKVLVHGNYSGQTCNTWFEVLSKNGMKYYYGNTSDSRQVYSNGKVNAWYLNSVEDPLGNYMDYNYLTSLNYLRLSSIVYGKNKNGSSNLENRVELTYNSRPDPIPFMLEDSYGRMDLLLTSIKSMTGSTTFREYALGYANSDCFSRLVSVTEKNGAGEALKPTILTWNYLPSFTQQCNGVTINNANIYPTVPFANQLFFAADMNGDGIDDLISIFPVNVPTRSNYAYIYWGSLDANGNPQFLTGNYYDIGPTVSQDDLKEQKGGFTPIDFNGDGIKELLIPHASIDANIKNVRFEFFNGPISQQGINIDYNLICSDKMPAYATGDINNDGKDDIIFMEKGQINNQYPCKIIGLNITTNYEASFNLTLPNTPEKMFVADFNGDGLADVLVFYEGGYTIFWNQGNGISSQTLSDNAKTVSTTIGNNKMIRMGDFNGDGLPDFIMNATNSNSWYFALNNGNGIFSKSLACTLEIYDQDFTDKDDDKFDCIVNDFDGDGKPDVIIHKAMYDRESDIWGKVWGEFRKTYTYWMRTTAGMRLSQVAAAMSDNEADACSSYLVSGDFNGDGKTELMNYGYNCYNGSSTNQTWRIYKNPGITAGSGMLASIASGYGSTTGITYASLTNKNIYTKGSWVEYPLINFTPNMSAVKSVVYDNGTAGTMTENYSYIGAKMHLQGKGFLGFMSTVKTNTTMGVSSEAGINNLDLTWFAPTGTYVKTTVDGNTSETDVYYTIEDKGAKKCFIYPNKKTEKDLDNNVNTTTYQYDSTYGYLTDEKTEFGSSNMYKATEYRNYILAGGTYKPQLINSIQKHDDDSQEFIQKTSITYDTSKGYPTTKVDNYNTDLALTTEFTNYDNFGNLIEYRKSGSGVPLITYHTDYDATNRFPRKTYTSPASTQFSYGYDTWGNLTTETDETNSANQLITSHTYDNWGRKTITTLSDGRKISYQTGWNNNDGNKRYFTLVQANGQPWVKTWYDRTGRQTVVETVGPKGMEIKTTNSYNSKGELIGTENRTGSLTITEDFNYDGRGRLNDHNTSSGKQISYSYGNRTVSTSVNGNTYTKTFDAWNGIKSSVDPLNNVSYTYKSLGKPWSISTNGAVVTMDYDNAGNQKVLTDPDAGTINYTYDAAGRLKTQVDAKGNNKEFFYDDQGRISYSTLGGIRTDYTYGTTGFDMNQLIRMQTGSNNISYTYDQYGRQITEKRQIDGAGLFEFDYTYNTNGLLQSITYPNGIQVGREYDAYGNLLNVSTGGQNVWELTSAEGTSSTTRLGNTMIASSTLNSQGLLTNLKTVQGSTVIRDIGYGFDGATGNLSWRTGMSGQKETFYYDQLDRLLSVKEGTPEVETMSMSYQPNGNIASKTGLGAYSYISSKPHAVSSVENTGGLIPTTNQSISYTPFNKAMSLSETVGSDAYRLDIMYGPDQQRWESVLNKNGSDVKTKVFAGDYEKITDSGITREFIYIDGGDGLAAVYVKEVNQPGKLYYAQTDHLGSIIALTDANGTAVFQANYDAWGKQTVTLNTIGFFRGFTGHEHLPEFGLINMNGRLYDPVLGRFLSTDPYIQEPDFSQNFNRYSYCVNNPLKYTDPLGEFFWIPFAIGAIIGGYTGYKIADAKGYDLGDWKTYGYILGGTVIGGLSGELGAEIAAEGGFMANTSAMVFSSYSYSVGMSALSGGMIQPNVNFGFGSYNFCTGEFNYLFDVNNKWYEDLGYGLGTIANISDLLKGFHNDEVQLQTENLTDAKEKDDIGHSQLTDTKGNSLVDYGPGKGGDFYKFNPGRNNWTEYSTKGMITQTKDLPGNIFNTPQTIKGVNMNLLQKYSNWLNKKPGFYNFALRSCSTQAARGLTLSGIPVFGMHPYLLRFQILNGLRPYMFNYTYTNGY